MKKDWLKWEIVLKKLRIKNLRGWKKRLIKHQESNMCQKMNKKKESKRTRTMRQKYQSHFYLTMKSNSYQNKPFQKNQEIKSQDDNNLRKDISRFRNEKMDQSQLIQKIEMIKDNGIPIEIREEEIGRKTERDRKARVKENGLPDNRRSSGLPEKERKNGLPEKRRSNGLLDKERKSGLPEKDKKSGLPEKEGKSGLPERDKKNGLLEKERKNGLQERGKKSGNQDKIKKNGLLEEMIERAIGRTIPTVIKKTGRATNMIVKVIKEIGKIKKQMVSSHTSVHMIMMKTVSITSSNLTETSVAHPITKANTPKNKAMSKSSNSETQTGNRTIEIENNLMKLRIVILKLDLSIKQIKMQVTPILLLAVGKMILSLMSLLHIEPSLLNSKVDSPQIKLNLVLFQCNR